MTNPDWFSLSYKMELGCACVKFNSLLRQIEIWTICINIRPGCRATEGSRIHMVWWCPMIHRYWMTIFHMINMIYDLSLLVDSKIGLLGILPGIVEGPKAEVITRILYMTRKRIAKLWVSANPSLVAHWVAGVNGTLEREKYTWIGTIHGDFFPCGRIGFLFW